MGEEDSNISFKLSDYSDECLKIKDPQALKALGIAVKNNKSVNSNADHENFENKHGKEPCVPPWAKTMRKAIGYSKFQQRETKTEKTGAGKEISAGKRKVKFIGAHEDVFIFGLKPVQRVKDLFYFRHPSNKSKQVFDKASSTTDVVKPDDVDHCDLQKSDESNKYNVFHKEKISLPKINVQEKIDRSMADNINSDIEIMGENELYNQLELKGGKESGSLLYHSEKKSEGGKILDGEENQIKSQHDQLTKDLLKNTHLEKIHDAKEIMKINEERMDKEQYNKDIEKDKKEIDREEIERVNKTEEQKTETQEKEEIWEESADRDHREEKDTIDIKEAESRKQTQREKKETYKKKEIFVEDADREKKESTDIEETESKKQTEIEKKETTEEEEEIIEKRDRERKERNENAKIGEDVDREEKETADIGEAESKKTELEKRGSEEQEELINKKNTLQTLKERGDEHQSEEIVTENKKVVQEDSEIKSFDSSIENVLEKDMVVSIKEKKSLHEKSYVDTQNAILISNGGQKAASRTTLSKEFMEETIYEAEGSKKTQQSSGDSVCQRKDISSRSDMKSEGSFDGKMKVSVAIAESVSLSAARQTKQIDTHHVTTPNEAYLRTHLGKHLVTALSQVTYKRPADPIHYLAQILYKQCFNLQARQGDDDEKENLLLQRELKQNKQKALKTLNIVKLQNIKGKSSKMSDRLPINETEGNEIETTVILNDDMSNQLPINETEIIETVNDDNEFKQMVPDEGEIQ